MAISPVESGRGRFDERASKGVTFAALVLLARALCDRRDAEPLQDRERTRAAGLQPDLVQPQDVAIRVGMRHLGDVSLFVAGFFAQSFARKLVDIDYHIAMGGRAYGTLADNLRGTLRGQAIAAVFLELAQKFQRLVDVLNDVAEMAYTHTDRDILRLYEIWLKTGSPRAYAILQRLGVAPVPQGARQEH